MSHFASEAQTSVAVPCVLCDLIFQLIFFVIFESDQVCLGLERFKTRCCGVSVLPEWRETGLLARQTEEERELVTELYCRSTKVS